MFAKRSLGELSAVGIATLAAFSAAYATDLPQAVPTAPVVLAQSKSTTTADEGHKMTGQGPGPGYGHDMMEKGLSEGKDHADQEKRQ